jgi:lycopene cyclase domain-containing protein
MDRWHYLLVLVACLAVTLPLELLLGARVYRRPGRLAGTVLPVLAGFLAWDLLAHARGHWWFDDQYLLGPRLAGLPVEEWLFFLVVPVCAVLTYEAVGRVRGRRRRAPADAGA